jgi:hypothetical protein
LRERVRSHRHRKSLQAGWQAHQQLRAIRQEDRIDDNRALGDSFKARDSGSGRIHAIVLEVIAQFSGLQQFYSVPRFN